MSKKAKGIIVIISLVILAAIVSVITYFFTKKDGSSNKAIIDSINETALAIGDDMDYITNIDRIIDNSYLINADGSISDEAYFNIVEILPNGVSSNGLEDYATNGGFKNYVIDANKETTTLTMKAGTVHYDRVNVNNSTRLADVEDILNKADLIYVSSPAYKSYTGVNNISTEVFDWLNTYALNDMKPIIMDCVRPYQPTALTYESFAYEVARNHIKYRTFFWDFDASSNPEDFFKARSVVDANGKNHNISYYLPFNVDNTPATGKALVISNGTDPSVTKMAQAIGQYNIDNLKANAYFGTESKKPSALNFTYMSTTEVNQNYASITKEAYDFIIIEADVKYNTMTQDAYNRLKTLSVTSQYIIYDKSFVPDDDGDDLDIKSSNYLKLMDMLISNKGVARYTNVLPVQYGFFKTLNEQGENALEAAKQVADLINYSDYRGSSNGQNGKLYRVLELQPCYPIDLDVAATRPARDYNLTTDFNGGPFTNVKGQLKGDYYTNPKQVLSGVSEDQVDGNTEYYKFELSKAKLSKALGLKYSQIRLDQMSTEEFIADKNVVLETYDLIYIGGNTSALTPRSLMALYGADSPGIPGLAYNYIPVFDMYTHTGYPVLLQATKSYGGASTAIGDKEIPYGAVDGYNKSTMVQYNGNDITAIKYKELKDYIDAGMPIIFSDVLTHEFENMYKQTRLVQMLRYHSIDPDSNMFALLKYAHGSKGASYNHILWHFDISPYENQDDYNSNVNFKYGPSLGSYVTLFTPESTAQLGKLVQDATRRPTLKIESKPKDYIEGYEGSYNVNEDGTMTITATAKPTDGSKSANFKLKLFIDINANGSFSEDEEMASTDWAYDATAETTTPMSVTYVFDDPEFYGLIHWKAVLTQENSRGECDIARGYAYYKKHEDAPKKDVNILQIMPRNKEANPTVATGEMDGHTLYLCTECQMAKYRATYNIVTQNDPLLETSGHSATLDNGNNKDVEMGMHQHKFGIVKYDTAGAPVSPYDKKWAPGAGAENWDSNYADLLADDYEFNMDIVYLDELAEFTNIIKNQTDEQRAQHEALLDTKKDAWEGAKEAYEQSGIKADMQQFLEGMKGGSYSRTVLNNLDQSGNITVTLTDEMIDNWIAHESYYRAFWFLDPNSTKFAEFKTLYANWVALHNPVVEKFNEYRMCKIRSYTSEEWLSKNYDVIVLGFAENFGGRDLDDMNTNGQECADLKSFVEKGGTLLTTHDSTTRYKDSGSVNLTTNLRETFGMDRYHLTASHDNKTGKYRDYAPISGLDGYGNGNEYYFSGNFNQYVFDQATGKSISYGPIKTGNQNLIVHVLQSGTNDNGENVIVEPQAGEIPEGQNLTITVKFYANNADYESGTQISILAHYKSSFGLYEGPNSSPASNPKYPAGTEAGNDFVITGVKSVPPQDDSNWEDPEYVEDTPLRMGDAPAASKYYQTFTQNGGVASGTSGLNPIYFITAQSVFDPNPGRGTPTEDGQRWYWEDKLKTFYSEMSLIEPIGVTDSTALLESHNKTGPYLYGESSAGNNAAWATSVWDDFEFHNDATVGGTNRASRNNTGIITTYPFTLGSELRIAKTHAQTFALDMEDEGIAVWYSLAGCDGRMPKIRSSMFAASPRDGMDSYFLYSYSNGLGNVNYCGAGHSCVTGVGRDNNDERRLYINLIVNAVRNKSSAPIVSVHEKGNEANGPSFNDKPLVPGKKDTNPYLDVTGMYNYNVEADDEIPEFNFKVRHNPAVDIKEIKVFYDLDYGIEDNMSNMYDPVDGNHVLIYSYSPASAAEDADYGRIGIQYRNTAAADNPPVGIVGRLRAGLNLAYDTNGDPILDSNGNPVDKLKLRPEYFTPYGNYTYIVIWTKDSDGKTAAKRVKIKLKETLFDLTDAGYQAIPVASVDVTDETRFYM